MGQGKLFLVGTPIGNLGDISPRALETLETVDFICAEDTRVTAKLLNYFNIKKSLVSCHQHSHEETFSRILDRIKAGESAALTTDAGMPCISDPGEELVSMAAREGVEAVAIPGPSAVVTALALSGLNTTVFTFFGFLPMDKNRRRERLLEMSPIPYTLVLYEAPHKLERTLKDLYEALGNRSLALCRELTKIHEEVIHTSLEAVLQSPLNTKGEYVLVIEGAKRPEKPLWTLEMAMNRAEELMAEGVKTSEACKQAALESGLSKSQIYSGLHP